MGEVRGDAIVGERWECATEIALGWLDLDHLGALVGEDSCAQWTRHHAREVEDSDPLERSHGRT